jgi:hypothetical protein
MSLTRCIIVDGISHVVLYYLLLLCIVRTIMYATYNMVGWAPRVPCTWVLANTTDKNDYSSITSPSSNIPGLREELIGPGS